jgi:hypothetical protein
MELLGSSHKISSFKNFRYFEISYNCNQNTMTQMSPVQLPASTQYPEPVMVIPRIMPHHLDSHINLATT